MNRLRLFIVTLLVSVTCYADLSLEDAVKRSGTVILMRHALAPGIGDPEAFQVDRCETQRNLNNMGRKQAQRLGDQLRRAGFVATQVYSSQWCRCLETAELLGLGAVIEEPGLNSFFQGYTSRTEALRLLNQRLNTLPLNQPPVIMVTHQVTITAITGLYTESGGMVSYDLQTGRAEPIIGVTP